MPHHLNVGRAYRAHLALTHLHANRPPEDLDGGITDLITNLLHYASHELPSFDATNMLARCKAHFLAEASLNTKDPPCPTPPCHADSPTQASTTPSVLPAPVSHPTPPSSP